MRRGTVVIIILCTALIFIVMGMLYIHNNYLVPGKLFVGGGQLVFENENSRISILDMESHNLRDINSPYDYFEICDVTDDYIVVKNSTGAKNQTDPSLSILDFQGNVRYKTNKDFETVKLSDDKLYFFDQGDGGELCSLHIDTQSTENLGIYMGEILDIHNGYIYYNDRINHLYRFNLRTRENELIYDDGLYSDISVDDAYAYIVDYNTRVLYAVHLETKQKEQIFDGPVRTFVMQNGSMFFTYYYGDPTDSAYHTTNKKLHKLIF